MKELGGTVAFFLLPVALLLMLVTGGGLTSATAQGSGSSQTGVTSGVSAQVPDKYREAVLVAGSTCATVTPGLIAAQIEAESNWNPDAVSSAGAMGISQFMPATWERWGVDGDGDGKADITNPADAIVSQGHYMCAIAEKIRRAQESKRVAGDIVELTVAAYNAGVGSIMKYRQIPPFAETQNYVAKIRGLLSKYEVVTPSDGLGVVVAGDGGNEAQPCIYHDPTRREPHACVTARTLTFINLVRENNLGGRGGKRMSCWDPHPWNPRSDHPRGRACDLPYSHTYATGEALLEGNQMAQILVHNAARLGVKYVIWQGKIWEPSTGWLPYRNGIYNVSSPSGGHYNHIHVSFY